MLIAMSRYQPPRLGASKSARLQERGTLVAAHCNPSRNAVQLRPSPDPLDVRFRVFLRELQHLDDLALRDAPERLAIRDGDVVGECRFLHARVEVASWLQ